MASVLYKRYVPPKKSAAPSVPAAVVLPAQREQVVGGNAPAYEGETADKKRKRERSEEEKAERKEKKLKKKEEESKIVKDGSEEQVVAATTLSDDARQGEDNTRGEFAHVKNAKKRHKLEKEARKAKKTAEKAQKDGRPSDPAYDAGEKLDRGHDVIETQTGAVKMGNTVIPAIPAAESANNGKTKEAHEYGSIELGDLAHKSAPKDLDIGGDRASHIDQEGETEIAAATVDNEAAPKTSDSPLPKTNKRRHRLEAVLEKQDSGVEQTNEDSDDHLKKHTSVMSKFGKATKLELHPTAKADSTHSEPTHDSRPEPTLRDLVPLPQPETKSQPEFKPDPSAMPRWIAEAQSVSSTPTQISFADMQLANPLIDRLKALGYTSPLPVQEALIPVLLPPGQSGAKFENPGCTPVLPDLAVSAPTGSGKTLAYLLPIIEALKAQKSLHRLHAMIVVPTRELAQQVCNVAETLVKGSNLVVGVVEGSSKFAQEQQRLVTKGRKFDPEQRAKTMAKIHTRNFPPENFSNMLMGMDEVALEECWDTYGELDPREEKMMNDTIDELADHIPTYVPSIDLLIATPGRLLEHMESTLGFTLANLQWLVLDEADRLLEQQYDGLLETLNDVLPKGSITERGCRKVVLSATMTRDISKLTALKLKFPKMLVVGSEAERDVLAGSEDVAEPDAEGKFSLPQTLEELCVPAGDGSDKPLYLLQLLETKILPPKSSYSGIRSVQTTQADASHSTAELEAESEDSNVSSLSDSSLSSSTDEDSDSNVDSGSGSDSDSDSDSDKDSIASTTPSSQLDEDVQESTNLLTPAAHHKQSPTVLIFASSTESAARLSHLLRTLLPVSLKSSIATFTRSGKLNLPSPHPQPSEPLIAVSSDRASRGLDTIASRPVTHVVQYDVPRSLKDYVHRAGRCARAGRRGECWTLYTGREARWFLGDVVKSDRLRRAAAVEKVKVEGVGSEEAREKLAVAVEGMRNLVFGRREKDTTGGIKR